MKAENISLAVGLIDDDIIEATDELRSRKVKSVKKNHLKQLTIMAACLCIVIGAATVFLQGFPIVGANAGSYPGTIVDGSYYYRTPFSFYRYTAGEKERLMSTFYVPFWEVSDYGIYYTKGRPSLSGRTIARSLYVREHETGKVRRLYTADRDKCTHVVIRAVLDGQIVLELFDWRESRDYPNDNYIVWVDSIDGDVIREASVINEQWHALTSSGNTEYEYPIGDAVYRKVLRGDTVTDVWYDLLQDGEIFLPGTEYEDFNLRYYGRNLIIRYRRVDSPPGDEWLENLLVTPDGEVIQVRNGRFLDGTDDYLFFIGDFEPDHPREVPVYGYDIKTGGSVYLSSMDVYEAVTDGTWFFTTTPWSNGKTNCWLLMYDADGKLIGLELWEKDI